MNFKEFLKKREVVFFDGAMGTNLDKSRCSYMPSCSEELNLKSPELVEEVHRSFIEAGADVIEINSFCGTRIHLNECGLAHKVKEVNARAVEIARSAIKKSAGKRKVFVSASIGPTSRLPSLGQISFYDIVRAYDEQIGFLLEAGIDLIQFETNQDILHVKAEIVGAQDAMKRMKREVPFIVTMTIEPSGSTLLGTSLAAALTTVLPYGPVAFGVNCSTGPREMESHVAELCDISPIPVIVMPNAGLPRIISGKPMYDLGPEDFAEQVEYFVSKLGVRFVGGCCGTTAEHIRQMIERVKKAKPRKRRVVHEASIASLYSSVPLHQDPAPLFIGERMNANGSKKFRELLSANDFAAASDLAREQDRGGAHAIDICTAFAGRDEIADTSRLITIVSQRSRIPIVIDSTDPKVIETALSLTPGRPIINSINLEDSGEKAAKILTAAKRFGACVVALTIDEDGMARTTKDKLAVAERILKLAKKHGLGEEDLLIDFLTFTLAEPKSAADGAGAETVKAIKKWKKLHPKCFTVLGLSNISHGFSPSPRKILNSAFLYAAVRAGLDAAIVHAGQLIPLHNMEKGARKAAMELIEGKSGALVRFMKATSEKGELKKKHVAGRRSPVDGLKDMIVSGEAGGLSDMLSLLLKDMDASTIINKILVPAMLVVGELFNKGELQLPFVLQSAEVMQRAVELLKPHMGTATVAKKGTIVIATVRGDVHDIGKNLVDIILTNNGFNVVNLGVKKTIEEIMRSAREHKADAIGLSGLLVQSCIVMKEDLSELRHRGVDIPVICGGAALTKDFVEKDLKKVYGNGVHYAKNAFDAIEIMKEIVE